MFNELINPGPQWSGALRRLAASRFFYPLITLLLGAVTYLYAVPWLGYFWDDWEVVFLFCKRVGFIFD